MVDFWNLIVQSNTFNFAILAIIIAIVCVKIDLPNVIEKIREEVSLAIENANSEKQSAEKEGLLHSTLFRVDAFEKNIPFTIMLGFGADFLTHTENPIQIEGSIIGGFSIITKKLGTYFVEGKVSPITYRDIDIPFEIKAGASFLLD